MKLLEKLKNTFFEEEYIEVEEPEKKEVVAKKVEPKEIKKEEKRNYKVEEKEPEVEIEKEEKKTTNYSDSELLKKDNKVSYFEEEDFLEEQVPYSKKEEPKKIYGESADKLYSSIDFSTNTNNKPYSAPLKEAFKPTPIISPIYGVLDKNYRKEEVIDRKDKPSSYVSRKNADLDTVRRKAYGGLDPFEESYTSENIKTENNYEEDTEIEDNLLYDMTSDTKPVVDQVTIADAEEYFEDLGLEYNIDYKDNRYEKATGRRTSSNHNEIKKEVITEDEDTNLEDNLFDIIDSMYEEGEN